MGSGQIPSARLWPTPPAVEAARGYSISCADGEDPFDRSTRSIISGVASAADFSNVSSTGTIIQTVALTNDATTTPFSNDYVHRYTDINPGIDGIFVLTLTDDYPYSNDDGYDINLLRLEEIVPEPATMSLLALGGLAILRRRKNK